MGEANQPLPSVKRPFKDTIGGQILISVASALIVEQIHSHVREVTIATLIVAGAGAVLLLVAYLSEAAPRVLRMMGMALYGGYIGYYIGQTVAQFFFAAPSTLSALLADPQHRPLTDTGHAFVWACMFLGAFAGAVKSSR